MFDLVITDGLVYDGLGNAPSIKDIGIRNERITYIGNLGYSPSLKKISAKGLIVSPGFIDMHSHSDVNYFLNPHADCKISQGVTTEVVGNCGGSAAPLYGEFRKAREKEWGSLGITIKWHTFKEYADCLRDNGIAVNVVPVVGHGNIRGAVKGYSTKPVTKNELTQMRELLNQSMSEGAFGFSTGLIYIPGMYAGTEELVALVEETAKYDGIYTTHIRSEGNALIESVKEAIEIAEKAHVKLQISHVKTSGKNNWKKINLLFETIEKAIMRGVDVSCDRYPYIASNTDLDTLFPNWFHEMTHDEKKDWINNRQEESAKVLKEVLDHGWEKRVMVGMINARSNFRRTQYKALSQKTKDQRFKWAEGKMTDYIAAKMKMSPEMSVVKILASADFQVQAMFFNMCEDNLRKILKKPYAMIGSDSSLRTLKGPLKIGHPHPRVFATFPRVIAKYTGKKMLSMEQAIHKMTGMPADKLGIENRGRIIPGAYADITIFDQKTIKDTASYEKPFQYPEGIETVIVNGEIVLLDGKQNKKLPGKVLLNQNI